MKALRIPKENRKLLGVCAAFANLFNVDVTFVRVILLCIVIFSAGTGLFAYLACWLIIPNEE